MGLFPGWRLHALRGDLKGFRGVIRRQVIGPLGLSVTEAAGILGVTRQALSLLLNERTDLLAEMALRIEKAFGPKMDA